MAAPKGNQYAKGCTTSGKPREFGSIEELSNAIEFYFNSISHNEMLLDGDKNPVKDNNGDIVEITVYHEKPGIINMCLDIGIGSDTLKVYEGYGEEYLQTIKRARERIKAYKLDSLYTVKNPRGVMFDLNVNYGMVEKKEQDINMSASIGVTIVDDI